MLRMALSPAISFSQCRALESRAPSSQSIIERINCPLLCRFLEQRCTSFLLCKPTGCLLLQEGLLLQPGCALQVSLASLGSFALLCGVPHRRFLLYSPLAFG
jgi:hypothetical protein